MIFVLGFLPSQTGVATHHPSLVTLFNLLRISILNLLTQRLVLTSVFVINQFCCVVVGEEVGDVEDNLVLLLFFVSVAIIRGHSPLHWEIIGTQPWITKNTK